MSDSPSWTVTTADRRWLRLLAYLPIAVLEGLYLALLGLLAYAFLTAPAIDPAVLAFALLFVLVGGEMSLLYLLPMLRDPAQRPTVPGAGPIVAGLTPFGTALAGLLGAGGWLLAFATLPRLFVGIGVLVAGVAVLTVSLVVGTGRVDGDRRRLEVGDRTLDLDSLTGMATHRIGSWLLLRPQFAHGRPRLGSPWLIVVPGERAEAVRLAVETAIESPADGSDRREPDPGRDEPDRLVQAVLGLAGLGFLVVAGFVALVESEALFLQARIGFAGVSALLGLAFLAAARVYA